MCPEWLKPEETNAPDLLWFVWDCAVFFSFSFSFAVFFFFFFFAGRGISNGERRQGWAPQTRLENFVWTDARGEGGAHCWRGSSGFYSTSSPCPPPPPPPPSLPTHIQFPYILSTAYHVIAETYVRKRADMCTGPGSTGRVRDTRCTAKNTINSSPPFLFSLFSLLLFASPLQAPCPSFFPPSPRHLRAICYQNLLISAPFFSKFSFSAASFPPRASLFPICDFFSKATVFKSQTTRQKDVFLCLTVGLLIDSCVFAFGSCRSKFHPAPLFLFFIYFFIVTHFSFTFSQLPHFCPSMEFFPPSTAAPPPPPLSPHHLVQSLWRVPLSILTCFLTPSPTSVLSWPCSWVPSSFINLSKWKLFFPVGSWPSFLTFKSCMR